jgi:iron(III) transport system ATP-binding protein
MPLAISIQDIRKVFGSGASAAKAVDGISLDIAPGELFFLLGPSGCGKTTLLRMIAGFIEPDNGRILFGDRDVTWLPPNRRNTGMVFQSYALWPHMTVEGNVAFGLGIRRVSRGVRVERVLEALRAVRMEEYASRRPNQLSGGQQQRVALARALVIRPDVLLLDEPLSNLDAKLRIDLRSEIRRICKESGISTIYVTHDQKEALSMADRVAIISQGRLVQLGSPQELYRRPASRFVAEFLGETNLIGGRVSGPAVIETAAGRVVTSRADMPENSDVLCSVRPEAMRILEPGRHNGHETLLPGRVIEATYLGELAQYVVELAGGVKAKVASLNPGQDPGARIGQSVTVGVAADDVVVLPRST